MRDILIQITGGLWFAASLMLMGCDARYPYFPMVNFIGAALLAAPVILYHFSPLLLRGRAGRPSQPTTDRDCGGAIDLTALAAENNFGHTGNPWKPAHHTPIYKESPCDAENAAAA